MIIENTKGHMLAGIDVETTGTEPGYHEVIQIAVQPVDYNLEFITDITPFYHVIRPDHPSRATHSALCVSKLNMDELLLHAPTKWQIIDWFEEWWCNLDLPMGRKIIPICQNWQFEAGFLKALFGMECFNQWFHWEVRDTLTSAVFINDMYTTKVEKPPFKYFGLSNLCKRFGVENENSHDALGDARACVRVYKKMLEFYSG